MEVTSKFNFVDSWLARSLVYYRVMDESLIEELAVCNSDENSLYHILVNHDYLNEREISQFVRVALKIRTIDLDDFEAEQDALKSIPEEICYKFNILPLQTNESKIAIAFSDPFNREAENELEFLTRKYIKKFFVPHNVIRTKINEYYSRKKVITSFVDQTSKAPDFKFACDASLDSTLPVVKLVNQIIANALAKEASDIRIEPEEKQVSVRYHIDGVLRNELNVPRSVYSALIKRIKIISNLNITETYKQQDGKAKAIIEDVDVDLRISILPTSYGEKVVIHLLDKRKATVSPGKMWLGINVQ